MCTQLNTDEFPTKKSKNGFRLKIIKLENGFPCLIHAFVYPENDSYFNRLGKHV